MLYIITSLVHKTLENYVCYEYITLCEKNTTMKIYCGHAQKDETVSIPL